MLLYHTSNIGEITEIHDEGRFGTYLFFSCEPMTTRDTYVLDASELSFIDASDFWWSHEPHEAAVVIADVQELFDCDLDTACSLLDGSSNVLTLFFGEEGGSGACNKNGWDLGEKDWDLQILQAKCGEALGYDVVGVEDEHGTSYMIDMRDRFQMLKKLEG